MKTVISKLLESNQNPCLFYPAIKELNYSLKEVLQDASKQAELLVYIQNTFDGGAVIRMTELWCEAASFGVEVNYDDKKFPILGEPIFSDPEDLEDVVVPEVYNEFTTPLIQAVELAVPQLEKPLIVGVTGPYSLASVLCGSEDFMCNCLSDEETVEEFLEKVTKFLIEYTLEYKKAGVAAVMIAEPSTAMISPDMMETFSNVYIQKIIDAVVDENFAIIYHNCGAANQHIPTIANLSADAFHFGSDMDMKKVLTTFSSEIPVFGNIEPQLYITSNQETLQNIQNELKSMLNSYTNFALSTGCDLSPRANVDIFRKNN